MNYLRFKDLKYLDYLKIFKKCFLFKKKTKNIKKKILFMFDIPSTRTILSFKTACKMLGCIVEVFDKKKSQMSRGEEEKDTYKVLSGYFNAIIYRGKSEKIIRLKKNYKGVIINALSEKEHPTQILNDLFTIFEIKKSFKFSILWIGKYNNVIKSLISASKIFKFNLKIFTDNKSKSKIKKCYIVNKIKKKMNIDFIMTDTWFSMYEKKKNSSSLKVKLKYFNKNTYLMHCLPMYRGQEIDKEVLNIKKNIIWKQSKNKLITAMGIINFFL
ncbi:ornithine carbamoyltransferase [Candidatus Vidania fulgoroideorum]